MGRKLIATIGILLILIVPMLFVMVPSASTLAGMVNLYSALTGPEAADKLQLATFAFVDADEETYTMRLDLGINNSGANSPIIFPQLNMTIKYGPDILGYGWVSSPVEIGPDQYKSVPIYMKMYRGDTFNKFFMSILAGGLNIALSDVEIYLFFNTFGNIGPVSSLVIPLSSLAMPAMSLDGDISQYYPLVHQVVRENTQANQPINFKAVVSDNRGGGVKNVILSYSVNNGPWTNVTMVGLPMKQIIGGPKTALGWLFTNSFTNYPNSSIPTVWTNATVNCTIPGVASGSTVKYRIYVIDTVGNTVIGPSKAPLSVSGSDTVDINNKYFSFTVTGSNPKFTANWEPKVKPEEDGGAGEENMMTNILNDLSAAGIDIMSMIMDSSPVLSILSNLNTTALMSSDPNIQQAAMNELMGALAPILLYFESKKVHGFEILDQLMGLSGGSPMFEGVGKPGDINWTFNDNSSVAFDMLGEAGVSLIDLINILQVNMTQVIDMIGDKLYRPTIEDKNPIEGLLILAKRMLANATMKQEFENYLINNNLIYEDFPETHVYYRNTTGNSWTNFTLQANDTVVADVNLTGAVNDYIYFAAPMEIPLLSTTPSPITKLTALYFNMSSNVNNGSYQYEWEFYNMSSGAWEKVHQM